LDWMKRWQKKGRTFDAVILDPPTFSQSKEHGRFQAEKDYDRLVEGAARLLPVGGGRGGVIMASTNAARLEVDDFLAMVRAGVERAGRRVKAEHYVAQPPDFPISREEPGYFKSVWVLVR
jgi:23S rRNA (cytosine1962-C5)-methyltransferase